MVAARRGRKQAPTRGEPMPIRNRLTRRGAVAALLLTAGTVLVPACGTDGPSGGTTSTTCAASSDTAPEGEAGATNTTVVGMNGGTSPLQGGSAGASNDAGESGSNSGAGGAPGPAGDIADNAGA